jgi:hypothetical protein
MKQNSITIFAGMALVAAVVGAGVAQAASYDISNDFSVASNPNPNGVWTYGFSSTLGGPLTNYDVGTTLGSGLQVWNSSTVQVSGAPTDINNPTGGAIQTCSSCSPLPANTAAFHPGSLGQFSVYQFTSPVTGLFNLSAIFAALDSGGTDVHILDNGISLYSHEIDPGNTPESFNTLLMLTLGDTIDFAVGVGTDGSFLNDTTSINANFTPGVESGVPEPSTWAMLLLGFAGVGFMAYRRRKSTVALAAA